MLVPGADPRALSSEQQAQKLLRDSGAPLGFLQYFNLHAAPGCGAVDALVRSREMAGTAAALLGAKRVRLYQVQSGSGGGRGEGRAIAVGGGGSLQMSPGFHRIIFLAPASLRLSTARLTGRRLLCRRSRQPLTYPY